MKNKSKCVGLVGVFVSKALHIIMNAFGSVVVVKPWRHHGTVRPGLVLAGGTQSIPFMNIY